jgi:hypothetical protein
MESQSDESRRRSKDESSNRIMTVKVSELHEMPGLNNTPKTLTRLRHFSGTGVASLRLRKSSRQSG